jgi:hypothetical protein
MKVQVELREKYRDLAASNMSTSLLVLNCCRKPGVDCDKKRNGHPSLTTEEKFEDQISFQSPRT